MLVQVVVWPKPPGWPTGQGVPFRMWMTATLAAAFEAAGQAVRV